MIDSSDVSDVSDGSSELVPDQVFKFVDGNRP